MNNVDPRSLGSTSLVKQMRNDYCNLQPFCGSFIYKKEQLLVKKCNVLAHVGPLFLLYKDTKMQREK
jgi:hypothetical protein